MQGIYKITNIINGNAYIGKSINIENRFKEHERRALFADTSKEFNKVLYKAIKKYGIENFRFEILEVIEDINLLNSREIFWIDYYNTYKKGYNQTIGGDGNKNVFGKNHPNHKVAKASIDKILQNEEIRSMVNAFGCGMGEGYGNDFNISKLKYDKIIIMSDADVDGSHISTLLLTFFYKFMPDLINEGHIYRAMPPLYKVIPSRGGEKAGAYVYTDEELNKYKKTHKNFSLQRYKGYE